MGGLQGDPVPEQLSLAPEVVYKPLHLFGNPVEFVARNGENGALADESLGRIMRWIHKLLLKPCAGKKKIVACSNLADFFRLSNCKSRAIVQGGLRSPGALAWPSLRTASQTLLSSRSEARNAARKKRFFTAAEGLRPIRGRDKGFTCPCLDTSDLRMTGPHSGKGLYGCEL